MQRFDFGALLEGLLDQRLHVGSGRRERAGFLHELEILLRGIAENRRKTGKGSLVVIPCFQQKKFGAVQLDFGEAQIDFRLELRGD